MSKLIVMPNELTDILLAAIKANQELIAITGGRVFDTANEVPVYNQDNTPVPYLVVVEKAATNDQGTKDWMWEGQSDRCAASIIICANTPGEVRAIRRKVRAAVEDYIVTMANQGETIPTLMSSSYEGVAWDDLKPCYNDAINYQCDMDVLKDEYE